jgi:hypothetical protein
MVQELGSYEAAGRDTDITSILPESSSICNTGTGTDKYKYPSIFQNCPVSAILEDTGHCQNMNIADTGRFWEILVIPVLQSITFIYFNRITNGTGTGII